MKYMTLVTVLSLHACGPETDQPVDISGDEVDIIEHALVIAPSADAYVRSNAPNANFGSATDVRADTSDDNGVLHGYMKFDVGAVGQIARARVRVYVSNGSEKPVRVITASFADWAEGRVTWTNRPTADGPTVATIGPSDASSAIDLDVTSRVHENSVLNLAFIPTSSDGFAFRSKEASSRRPSLILELVPPDMPPTVSLMWDPSPSAGVTYRLYQGSAPGAYTSNRGLGSDTQASVTGLTAGTYFFAVTALEASGNESIHSNELTVTVP